MAGTDPIERAAERVAEQARAGLQPIAVVSAMAGITDQLLALARRLQPDASGEELDRLLATGETQSAALLALALRQRGFSARSFSGRDAGIVTDASFGRARILTVHPSPIAASLAAGETPVVAGFQGETADGRITTLGRGGADISAMALAVTHHADRVVVYRDLEGVHSADPRMMPLSYRLERLDYESMVDLAEAGIPIVHAQALEIARAHGVPIEIRGVASRSDSTLVSDTSSINHLPVWMIGLSHPIAVISLDSLPLKMEFLAQLFRILERSDLQLEACVQSSDSVTGVCMMLALPDLEGPALYDQLQDFLREERGVGFALERRRRKLTLVGRGVASRRVELAIDHVAQRLGPPLAGFRGQRHRAFVLPDEDGKSWLASLHQELIRRDAA